MKQRTTVLLGAGASADAGLPLTFQLAERLVTLANQPDPNQWRGTPNWVRALNFVYGAQIGFQAEDGSNPLQAVNIERLISALRLLQNADEHEVAPFVASWKQGALGVGTPSVDEHLGEQAIKAVGKALLEDRVFFERSGFTQAISQIARAAVGSRSPEPFREAERQILQGLSSLLSDIKTVEYLLPLVRLAEEQEDGLDILTLNYDLTVEAVAKQNGVTVCNGIENWEPGRALLFNAGRGEINLYKMHGSLDWVLEQAGNGIEPPKISVGVESLDERDYSYGRERLPWIVVGDREKLSTDGPMLQLMRAAEDALSHASNLVVVGYSFGDRHINNIIRDWMLGDPARTLVMVDIDWTQRAMSEFCGSLISVYGANKRHKRESRIVFLEGTAANCLEQALDATPFELKPNHVVVESTSEQGGCVRATLSLSGADLKSVSIRMEHVPADRSQRTNRTGVFSSSEEWLLSRSEPEYRSNFNTVNLNIWRSGDEVSVCFSGPTAQGAELVVSGQRLDSSDGEEIRLPI